MPDWTTALTVPPDVRPYSAEYADVCTLSSRSDSTDGMNVMSPVDPTTAETPSIVTSVFAVRLPRGV